MENLPPLEMPASRRSKFSLVIASLLAGALLLYFGGPAGRIISVENQRYRTRIDKTVDGAYVRPISAIIENAKISLDHPYVEQFEKTTMEIHRGQSDSATWLEIKMDPRFGALKGVPPDLPVGSLSEVLMILRRAGQNNDEEKVLRAALNYKGMARFSDQELAWWAELCCINPAKKHFQRHEYFLGMAAVREGLAKLRSRKIRNLSGADHLTAAASPLIIIDAFLPGDLDPAYEDGDLSGWAALVLEDDYSAIAKSVDDSRRPTALQAYAAGVVALRKKDYHGAIRHFVECAEMQGKHEAQDLARFMVVRATFWDVFSAKNRALQSLAEPVAQPIIEAKLADALPGEDAEDTDDETKKLNKHARVFAKAVVAELAKAGAFRQGPPPPQKTLPSLKHRQPTAQQKELLMSCKASTVFLQHQLMLMASSYWKVQARDYQNALRDQCE